MSTDFSSIDRLMELGLGLELAQQMVSTMNHAMSNMQVAGINSGLAGQRPVCPAPQQQWYAVVDGRLAGPLSDAELSSLITRRLVDGDTLVWCTGMTAWRYAADVPQVNKLLLLKP